jgi:hypothetical protein
LLFCDPDKVKNKTKNATVKIRQKKATVQLWNCATGHK